MDIASNNSLSYEFVIYGDRSVGKSWLMSQFVGKELVKTIGPLPSAHRVLEVDAKSIKITIEDTFGHDRTFGLTINRVKTCSALLLVYDVTNRSTFTRLTVWLDRFKPHKTSSSVYTLVGNKCDLYDDREVSTKEGEAFARNHGFLFIEVSADTGENVEAAFRMTAVAVYTKNIQKVANTSKTICRIV